MTNINTLIQQMKKDILKEIRKRKLSDIVGWGISIEEHCKREKRKEPVELEKWINWYFEVKLKSRKQ